MVGSATELLLLETQISSLEFSVSRIVPLTLYSDLNTRPELDCHSHHRKGGEATDKCKP